jgi:predicted DNA-binding transcriptional regulator AlpA
MRTGGESITELIGGYGVSRATIYRALRDQDPSTAPT